MKSKPRYGNRKGTQVEWSRIAQATRDLADRLGKPIDTRILDAVVSLRAYGLETTASCEGHIRWGTPAPWIDVGVMPSRPWKGLAKRKLDVECKFRKRNLRSQRRMLTVLSEFYHDNRSAADVRLILIPAGVFGGFRLINQGAAFQDLFSIPQRTNQLRRFQREFGRLASFMRQEYLRHRKNRSDGQTALATTG